MESKTLIGHLYNEIDFFKITGLNKDLAHIFEDHNGIHLNNIEIITPEVLAHIEAGFQGFIRNGDNPFFPRKKVV